MKRTVNTAFALIAAVSIIWLVYPVAKEFLGALKNIVEMRIYENPTASAKSYAGSLETSASSIVHGSNLTVVCRIANVGNKSIRQMVVQINLRDDTGRAIEWKQGPVIRKYTEERGFLIQSSYTEQQQNTYSKFEAPFRPGRRIVFRESFRDLHDNTNAITADIQVMDIEFTDN